MVRLFSRAAASRSAVGRLTRGRPDPTTPGVPGANAPSHSETDARSGAPRFGDRGAGGTPAGNSPDHSDGGSGRVLLDRWRTQPAATPATNPTPKPAYESRPIVLSDATVYPARWGCTTPRIASPPVTAARTPATIPTTHAAKNISGEKPQNGWDGHPAPLPPERHD